MHRITVLQESIENDNLIMYNWPLLPKVVSSRQPKGRSKCIGETAAVDGSMSLEEL